MGDLVVGRELGGEGELPALTGAKSVGELMTRAGVRWGRRVALRGVGFEEGMTYKEWAERTAGLAGRLKGWGMARGDRVATYLPGAAGAMGVLVAVMEAGVYAPLNPRYSEEEALRGLAATRARWIVVEKGKGSAGRAAAERLGAAVIEMETCGMAGAVTLTCERPAEGEGRAWDGAGHVLLTSGTTGLPKVVPMQLGVYLGAIGRNLELLELAEGEKGLHVASLAHSAGMTGVICSVMSGGELVSCPGVVAGEFWGWVRKYGVTWMSATPTMHHAVVKGSAGQEGLARGSGVRFMRTVAAPMAPALWEAVERLWGVPLVEAYAMSECPVMTSNTVGEAGRRRGSVGREVGIEMAVMDAGGRMLTGAERAGVMGELAVRGELVMRGYEGNPEATGEAFREGWLMTGDLGEFDAEGFLFMRGRKKELINRGGVKISPVEVEGVVGRHPAVSAAVVFGIADERLGETVGAAVVVREGMAASEAEVRGFVARELGMEKVPERVVFVEELPVGPTGKVVRAGLAERLGVRVAREARAGARYAAPGNAAEEALAAMWCHVLRVPGPLSVEAHFVRDLGGDSLQAVAMLAEAAHFFGRELPVATLLAAPSIRELARALEGAGVAVPSTDVVAIQPRGERPVLFCLPGMYGQAFTFYPLSRALGDGQPVYGLTLPGVYGGGAKMPGTLEELAGDFVKQVRRVREQEGRREPFYFAGYSFGGYLAFEMARQLAAAGEAVGRVILFDTRGPGYPRKRGWWGRVRYHAGRMRGEGWGYVAERVRTRAGRPAWKERVERLGLGEVSVVSREALALLRGWKPGRFEGAVTLVRAREAAEWLEICEPDETMGWGQWAGTLEVVASGGSHDDMLESGHAEELGGVVAGVLGRGG